jgi:hypothetical protein
LLSKALEENGTTCCARQMLNSHLLSLPRKEIELFAVLGIEPQGFELARQVPYQLI